MTEAERRVVGSMRKIYSVAEAGAAIGLSESYVLALGSQGRLPMYIRVPDDVRAYRSCTGLLDMNNGTYSGLVKRTQLLQFASGVRPRELSDAYFLVLEPHTCELLAALGEASQREFRDAYRISAEMTPAVIDQPRVHIGTEKVDIGTELVVCYARHQEPCVMGVETGAIPVSIPLTARALRISHGDLVELGLLPGNVPRPFDNGFKKRPYMSKKLIDLNDAAWHFWARDDRDWKPPLKATVTEWFQQRKWKIKAAEAADTILRDSYARWNPEDYDSYSAAIVEERRGKPMSFAPAGLNKFDAVVFIAQRWENADLQQGERTEKLDTYPDRAEGVALLQNKYGFAEHLAIAAWRIASPENVVKRGRPRSPE